MNSAEHLSDQSILLALDGEAGSREAAGTRAHLEACWACRARRERIKQVISNVVEYQTHDELLDRLLPRPRARRIEFLQRLDQLADNTAKPWFNQTVRLQIGLAASLLVVLFLAGRLLERPPSVSANELLRRADASELAEVPGISRPVVYRKVRIRSGNQTVTRTTYRDAASRKVVDRMDPPDQPFLEAAFTHAGFDWREPLSAAGFTAWRGRLSSKTDEVRKVGPDSLVLSTSASDGLVQKASLTVRASDWHPVAERLILYDSRELEMTELDYRVLSMDAIAPGIFENTVLPAAATPRTEPINTAEASVEPAKGPSVEELGDAELQALLVLHNANADTGEDVTVLRTGSGVVVQGVVETPARKQELIAALSKLAYIQLRLQTVAEATLSQPEPLAATGDPQTIDSALTPPLLQSTLEKQFPNVEDRSGFINQALEIAQEALSHASALRGLGSRYAASTVAGLNPDSRRQLAELLLDHANLLRQQLLTERALVSALVLPADDTPVETAPSRTWQETVAEVLPEVRRVHSDVVALFGSSNGSSVSAQSTVAGLRRVIARLDTALLSLSKDVNSQSLK